jgi:chemosensory pili system protein ChpA (sensor histidine kinase/response regulator)
MNPQGTADYNSISWVKKQLDEVLAEAQHALSDYIEDNTQSSHLQRCIDNLRLVYGTLQMVEVYGAAMLAEEMEQTARAQLEGKVDKPEDVYDVLMRAMLQLPDYLEGLQSGSKDTPIALLPLMNDLRAARKENLLSENVLFLPDVDSVVLESDVDLDAEIESGKLQNEARRLRKHYQLGLLDFLKNQKQRAGLKRMMAVVTALEKVTAEPSVRRFWMVISGLLEALLHEGVDSNISVKMLLGSVDRQIKLLIDNGEEDFVDNYSHELLKNLLYYIGRSTSEGPRVSRISKAYRLDELLPSEASGAAYDASMGGLNAELFNTVSQGINEDLSQVKDTLELYAHSSEHNTEQLRPLIEQLGRIGDTYGMLGIGSARQRVLDQRGVIEKIVAGELEANENQVMSVAAELLAAESELRNFIAERSGAVIGGLTDSDSPIPTAEFRQVLSTVIVEGLKNFTMAKEAILSFISGIGQEEQLDIILQKLEEVRGITMMMPMSQIESQINKLMLYVRVALRDNHHRPEAEEQDVVADVVTAIEYYLEAVAEGRPGVEAGLRAGDIAAEKLIAISDKYTAMGGGDILLEETAADDGVATTPDASAAPAPAKTHDSKNNLPESKKTGTQRAPESQEKKTEYEIISDDADPEIVEIFIEEALEVLDDLHRCLPAWRSNQEDAESLSTVRRSFHTLKGSGRLIGADLIGEFSWKVENMLNRVIENKIQTSDVMFEKMEEALSVLPQLIEQINGNREPVTNVRELMDIFDALSEGRDPSMEIAAEHLASTPDIGDSESQTVTLSIVDNALDKHDQFADQGVSAQADDLQFEITRDDEIELIDTSAEESEDTISVIDVESFDMEVEAPDAEVHQPYEEEVVELAFEQPAEDSIEIDLSEASQAVESTQISAEDRRDTVNQISLGDELDIEIEEDAYPDEDARNIPEQMDPVLFSIYYDESQSHLDKVESMLTAHHNGAVQLHANKDLVRAFHTLYGSARTAEIEPIAELCGATEKYIKAREEASDINIPDVAIGLITEVKDDVRSKLDELKNGGMPSSNKQLLDRIIKLVQNELQSQLQESSRKSVHDYSRSAVKETPPAVVQEDEFSIEMDELAAEPAIQASEPVVAEAPAPASMGSVASHSISYSEIDGELIDIFLEEAEEILESCESGVLGVIEDPDDSKNLQNLQRHMHTLKGGARMAELTPVGDLTHNLETLLITLTEGSLKPDKVLFDTLHESLDVLTSMLSSVKQRKPIEVADELNAQIESIMRGEVPEKRSVERFDVDIEQLAELEPEVKPERRATDKLATNDGAKNDAQFQPGRRASDEQIEPAWGERATDASNRDSQELVRVRADLLNSLVNYAGEVNIYHARMGKQVTDIGFNLAELEQTVVRLKDQLRNLEIETELQIRSNYEKVADQYGADFDPLEMDRYSTLQQLSRSLSETAGDVESINGILGEIVRDSETLLLQESRVSTDLQEGLMRTRMVRFGGLGTRLRRIVRQTAKELGKDVELEIKGDTSEVDRTVLDRIIAPLEHMLRNAVAHGIEKPNDRVESGKPETGTITINVDRQAADVIIRVEDDGAGINVNVIRNKAIERGLMEADSALTDHDVLQFILKSGFSTATEVTQVSGRGVGMDVVDSEIKQLGGSFEIDTKQGKGTSFKVRLPLTLAINQALLVNAADDVYAVPLASIEGVVRITGAELQSFYNSGQLDYEFNGVLYELKHLGRLLTGEQADYSDQYRLFPVLLAKVGDQHYALHVDDLIGRREIVVKPVGLQIGLVRGIAGATILADGRVVLILEMSALVVGESLFKQVREEDVVLVPEAETTVMVVDDSITIRKVTERILLRNGIKVLLAKDGVDATNILQDHKPDLMLLDIEMPRMDGFELATYIRNDDRLKDLPIIMITSRTGTKHKEKAMEIGVNQYLGKPYQEEELMKNINDLLFANG